MLGIIQTVMGHHYDFEFVLGPGLEPRSPECMAQDYVAVYFFKVTDGQMLRAGVSVT